MWLGADGIIHTNAHATPTECMTEEMLASLAHIAKTEGEAGADFVFAGLEEIDPAEFASLTSGLEDQWIPDRYLDGHFTTSVELREYLRSLDIDWRYDAFFAVDDVLASLTEVPRWRRFARWLRRA